MKRCLFVAVAFAAGAVSAGDVLKCGRGAQAEFQPAGVAVRLEGFLPGWKSVNSLAGGKGCEGGVVPFKMDWRTAKGCGNASFAQLPEGKVSARWFMTVDCSVKIEQLFLGVKIPLDKFDGGKYEYDGNCHSFPKVGSSFIFGHAKGVKTLSLVGRDGATRCEMELDRPHDVFMQDNSRFGGGFELRIMSPAKALSPGEMHCFGATLSTPAGLALATPSPVKIVAGDGWVPMRPSAAVKPGSALDFSSICGIDAPAGKYGRVVVRNGRFEFLDRPGVAQRFYGVNLCFGANYGQTKQEADAFASRLARLGYNAVRLHHHDGLLAGGAKDGTKINPGNMAELDALVAALFENGIYVTTDLYVSRRVPYRQCGVDRDGEFEMGDFKDAVRTNDAAAANLARFAKEWLTHVNPYTGRRWADEPGIVGISLVNENCPDNRRRLSPSEAEGAMAAEDRFFARMKQVVRGDVGSEIPLTDLNGWSMNPAWESCRRKFDYVDMHFYVDHPRFLETPWRLPSSCANVNPLRGEEPHGVSKAGRCRLAGKPFTVTEWNFAAPGKFRCAGGVVTGAWAAKHDWDGLWRFAWSHDIVGVKTPEKKPMGYFDMSGDPLLLASERATMCLFLRRDLAVGDDKSLVIGGKKGTLAIDTPRTCGFFSEGGRMRAGCLAADCGDAPTTIWASSIDGNAIADSSRILLTHLTDVQNTGTTYEDDTMDVLTEWGGLPHLMRNARAKVALALSPGKFEVFALDGDGSRRKKVPSAVKDGRLVFVADIAADRTAATYLYEIVRQRASHGTSMSDFSWKR